MVVSTFIGLGMGYYLDKWLETDPWMTLSFLLIGIISGFRNIFILTSRELRRQKKLEEAEADKGSDRQG